MRKIIVGYARDAYFSNPDVSTVGEYEGKPYSIVLHFSTEDSGTYYFVGFGSDCESKGDFSLGEAVFLE